MATFRIIETPTGPAVQWGSGESFDFEHGNDDSLLSAVIKAVNVGVEAGDEIGGEVGQAIATILKQIGDVAWPTGEGFQEIVESVQAQLPKNQNGYSDYSVKDISRDGSKALVCNYSGKEGYEHYIIPLTVHGTGEEMTVVLAPESGWTPVEEEFVVAKAGRVLSGLNLQAVEAAIEALNAVADRERGRSAQESEEVEETEKASDSDLEYVVLKSATEEELRYTLGPLYAPNRKDAHGEWAKDTTLQKSQWDYVRESADAGRRINLQHGDSGDDVTVGEWVDIVTWPFEQTLKMKQANGAEEEVTLPAGTVYMGVVWDEDAWPLVKSGKLNGYSLGGRAVKVRGGDVDMASMGFKAAK